nr:hypothetical protein CFP56_68799 [Quercus suber]
MEDGRRLHASEVIGFTFGRDVVGVVPAGECGGQTILTYSPKMLSLCLDERFTSAVMGMSSCSYACAGDLVRAARLSSSCDLVALLEVAATAAAALASGRDDRRSEAIGEDSRDMRTLQEKECTPADRIEDINWVSSFRLSRTLEWIHRYMDVLDIRLFPCTLVSYEIGPPFNNAPVSASLAEHHEHEMLLKGLLQHSEKSIESCLSLSSQ